MKTAVVFITNSRIFKDYVSLKKTQIVPDSLRASDRGSLFVSAFTYKGQDDKRQLDKYLSGIAAKVDRFILFIDASLDVLKANFTQSFFVRNFDSSGAGKSLHNYIGMTITPAIKTFDVYASRFGRKCDRDVLLLPLRNFNCEEVRTLERAFDNTQIDASSLALVLETFLKEMRQRRKPKTFCRSQKMFLIDDNYRYFEFAHEDHARFDTANPPHNEICVFRGCFRFGAKIESGLHYNVSVEGSDITGEFTDCHGETVYVKEKTHLNMFSNGFW